MLKAIKQESDSTPLDLMPSIMIASNGANLVELLLPTVKRHVKSRASYNPLAAYLHSNANWRNTRVYAMANEVPVSGQREEIIDVLSDELLKIMEPNQIGIVFLGMNHILVTMNTAMGKISMASYTWVDGPSIYTHIPEGLKHLTTGLTIDGDVDSDVIKFILGVGNMKINNLGARVLILNSAIERGLA